MRLLNGGNHGNADVRSLLVFFSFSCHSSVGVRGDGDVHIHIHVHFFKVSKRVYSNNTTWKEGRTPKIQGMKLGNEI